MSTLKLLQNDDSLTITKLIEANKKAGWPDLEPWQKSFCAEYIECYSHRDAAKLAGKSPAQGVRILRDPLVSAYIAFLQEKITTRKIITREFIESEMLELNDIAMGRVETKLVDKDGIAYSAEVHNLPVARAVQTEMAKATKFYEDGSSQGGTVEIQLNLGGLGIKPDVAKNASVRGVVIEGELSDA